MNITATFQLKTVLAGLLGTLALCFLVVSWGSAAENATPVSSSSTPISSLLPLSITKVSPSSGVRGQYVTILGDVFGGMQGEVSFVKGAISVPAQTAKFPESCRNLWWNSRYIIVAVPDGLETGSYALTIKRPGDSVPTRGGSFRVVEGSPSVGICGILPDNGVPGTQLEVFGMNFGSVKGHIKIASKELVLTDAGWSNSLVTSAIPALSEQGSLQLVTADRDMSNPIPFTLGRCSQDACSSSQTCCSDGSCKPVGSCKERIPMCRYSWNFYTGIMARLGEACTENSQCSSGTCGVNHACTRGVKKDGESCKFDAECTAGLACKNGKCASILKRIGESCTANAECSSQKCDRGSCALGVTPVGGACSSKDQCATLNCYQGSCGQSERCLKVEMITPPADHVTPQSVFSVIFNQLVDDKSAKSQIHVEPSVQGVADVTTIGSGESAKSQVSFRPSALLSVKKAYFVRIGNDVKARYSENTLGNCKTGSQLKCTKAGEVCSLDGSTCTGGSRCTGIGSMCSGSGTVCTGQGSRCQDRATCVAQGSSCYGGGTTCLGDGSSCYQGAQCLGKNSVCHDAASICKNDGSVCKDGASCTGTQAQVANQSCASGTCANQGATCASGTVCTAAISSCTGSGTLCMGDTSSCKAGAVCGGSTADCSGKGTLCVGSNPTCAAGASCPNLHPGGPGSTCSSNTQCQSGSCVENKCTSLPGTIPPGGTCLASAECSSGTCNTTSHTCTGGPGGVDAPCTSGSECQSGSCVENKCTIPPGTSQPGDKKDSPQCTQNNQCRSGQCDTATDVCRCTSNDQCLSVQCDLTTNHCKPVPPTPNPNPIPNPSPSPTPVSAPSQPQHLTTSSISSSQINLLWDATTGEKYLVIERSGDGTSFSEIARAGIGTYSYADLGLSTFTQYWYRVKAVNDNGSSAYSDVANARTWIISLCLTGKPGVPVGFAADPVSSSRINLSWIDSSTNEDAFKIERSRDQQNFASLYTLPENSQSYSDAVNLIPSTAYYYRISAVNCAGASSFALAGATTFAEQTPKPTPPEPVQCKVTETYLCENEVGVKYCSTKACPEPQPTLCHLNSVCEATETCGCGDCAQTLNCKDKPACTGDLTRCAKNGQCQINCECTPDGPEVNNCSDNKDNDCNGKIDAVDAACQSIKIDPDPPIDPTATAPTKPQHFRVTGNTKDSVSLAWDLVTNEKYLLIERLRDDAPTGTAYSEAGKLGLGVVSFTDYGAPPEGLTWNTKYRYRVKAVNDAGSSDYTTVDGSTSWNPLCLSGTPDVPGTFTARSTISTDRIDLSWTEGKAVTLFNLQYALSSQSQDWTDVQLTQDRRTFSLTGLTANTEYSFRVRATNGCADPSGYSAVVKATTLTVGQQIITTAPTKPQHFRVTGNTKDSISLAWDSVTNEKYLLIERLRDDAPTGTAYSEAGKLGLGVVSFTDYGAPPEGLTWNTKYRYRVKAVNDAGSSDYTTVDGSTSWNPLCLSGTPDVPGTFTAKPTISTDRIDLSWTETKAVTLFNLQYALSSQPQDWSDVQLTQDRRTFSLTGLIANTEYSFRVRAANGCADPSGYSTVVKATTLTVGHDQDPIQVVGVDRLGSIKIFAGTTPVTADFVDHFTNDNQHRYSVQAFQADGVTVSKDIGRVIWGVAGSGVAISSISDASPTQATGALVSASSAAQTSGAVSATIVSAADSSIERQAIVSFDVAIPVVVVDPPAETRVLTVEKTGVCSGTITSSVGSIICGTDAACRATIAKDSGVELTEVATAGCVFAGWGGVCSSSGSTPKCSLTLSDNATATARFNAIIPGSLFEVNITKDGDGTGSVTSTPAGIDCGGTCSANLRTGSVTLQETPDADSHFSGWTIAGNNPIDQVTTFALSSTTTAKATFSKNEPSSVKYKLSVFKSGNGDGMITSTSTPAEAGISCGSVCEKEYGSGTKVKLTATSNSHSFFDGWSGGSCSGTAPCTFVLDQAAQITANFHSESIGVVKMYELPPSPSPSRRIDGGMDVFTCAKQVGCTDDADTGAPGNQHAYSVQVFRKPTIADLTPSVVHDISKLIVSSAPSIQAQPAVIAKIISMNEYLIASAISCYKQTNASKRYNCRGTSITPIADQSLEDAIRKFTLNELYINYQGPRPAAFFDQSKITGALSTYSGFEVNPQTVVWSFSGNAGVFAKDAVDDRKGTITASATKNEPGKNTSTLQAVVTGFDEKQSTVSAIISNENCDYPWEYTENTADFRMHYCAGVGTQDLPLLKTSWERTTLEAPFTTEKVFQFTDLSSSTDAIVLRTAPNPTWAKLTDWYLVNVPYGSPSETIINGYPAIRDTFGTYVNALSTSTAGWVPKIYYFTANTNAGATTRSILDSLIIPGLEFSRGEKYSSDGSPASHDFGGLKLRRDMQRIYAMRDLQVLLTKSVPISAGSYLINQTLSAWKSWTSVLANAFEITLPIDPYYGSGVSQFGGPSCGASSNTECTCSGDFDKFTCMKYSTSTSTFNFSNVESSLASAKSHFYTYVYTPAVGNSVASSEVCAKLELGVVAYSGIVGGKLVTSTNPAGLYCVKNP